MLTVWRRFYGPRRFSVLLVILLILFAGTPILLELDISVTWFDGIVAVFMLASIFSLCFERHQRIYALVIGVPAIVLSGVGHRLSGSTAFWLLFVSQVVQIMFLVGASWLIVKSLFQSPALTFDSISGAVCGYLFLGLGWSVFYLLIIDFWPDSFLIDPALVKTGDPQHLMLNVMTYYSFITLTTIGYGDMVPTAPLTRTLAWMEAVSGQFYLAVVVASLVSLMPVSTRSRPKS